MRPPSCTFLVKPRKEEGERKGDYAHKSGHAPLAQWGKKRSLWRRRQGDSRKAAKSEKTEGGEVRIRHWRNEAGAGNLRCIRWGEKKKKREGVAMQDGSSGEKRRRRVFPSSRCFAFNWQWGLGSRLEKWAGGRSRRGLASKMPISREGGVPWGINRRR